MRRHDWSVAGAVTLVLALAGAAVYAAGQAREARAAAAGAQLQNRFLNSVFRLAGTDTASRHDMTVRELLALAEARIAPSLGVDARAAADVEATLGAGYLAQDAPVEARVLFERSLLRARALGDRPREATALAGLAYVSYLQNQGEQAAGQARAALAAWRQHGRDFTPAQAVAILSSAANTLSYLNTTDPDTRDHFEACLAVARANPDAVDAANHARCLLGLGIAYTNLDSRYVEADVLLRDAAALQRADPAAAAELATTLQMLGFANRYRGQFAADEAAQREARDIMARLQGPGSAAALWQRAAWATSLIGVGRHDEAYREARAILTAARAIYPERGSYLLWTPLIAAASAACITGQDAECAALAAEAIETLGPQPAAQDPRRHGARGLLGLVLARQGRLDEARPLIEGALAMNAARQRSSPFTALFQAALQGH